MLAKRYRRKAGREMKCDGRDSEAFNGMKLSVNHPVKSTPPKRSKMQIQQTECKTVTVTCTLAVSVRWKIAYPGDKAFSCDVRPFSARFSSPGQEFHAAYVSSNIRASMLRQRHRPKARARDAHKEILRVTSSFNVRMRSQLFSVLSCVCVRKSEIVRDPRGFTANKRSGIRSFEVRMTCNGTALIE